MESPPVESVPQALLPVTWRELFAVTTVIGVSDLTIFRGHGFAGIALLLFVVPGLLWLGSPRPLEGISLWTVTGMLIALSIKLLWSGTVLSTVVGFALLVAFAMALSGRTPHLLEGIVFASQTVAAGAHGLIQYSRNVVRLGASIGRFAWLNYVMPLVALVVFGMIFVLANPDLVSMFSKRLESIFTELRDWLLASRPSEVIFWGAVAWITVGLLRPITWRSIWGESPFLPTASHPGKDDPAQTTLYPAFRNTLITVILLFAVYLAFEFKTLWFRVFPQGFYFSGYAHEGAAWLTIALALATVVLSLILRPSVMQDQRASRLRQLAWLWSFENFLLAIAVYHRMLIYVGFNGMTRMRVVGFFGISTVVIGFVLVLYKVVQHRDFVWLIRRQLWALAVAIYIYAIIPVDTIVCSYNVRRILGGDPAPAVQISVHPISAEGILLLRPLVDCNDSIIREGAQALLAKRQDDIEQSAKLNQIKGWTTYQVADRIVLDELRADQDHWERFSDVTLRERALKRFHDYTYQWY